MRRRIYVTTLVSVLTLAPLGCGSNNSPPLNQQPGATPTPSPSPSPVAVPFPVPVPVPIPEPFPVPVPVPRNGWIEAQEQRQCGQDCNDPDVSFTVFADGTFVASVDNNGRFTGKITSHELDSLDALSTALAQRDLKEPMSCFQADFDSGTPQIFDNLGLTDRVLYPIYLVNPAQQAVCFNDGFEAARAFHLYVQFLAGKYATVATPSPSPSASPSVTPSRTASPTPSVTVTITPAGGG